MVNSVTKVRQENGRILCFENLVIENGEIHADRIRFEDSGDMNPLLEFGFEKRNHD